MYITEIKQGIHYVGVNDRTKHRFEGLWSLPYGVSYNSYLVVDDKVALIDTVDEAFASRFMSNIDEVLQGREIDYLVVNHMEADHSAAMATLRMRYPRMQIVGNAKTLQMIEGLYGITDNTLCIKEGESLSLGGRTLQFYMAPMVHWPEVMVTYCPEQRVLFSADAFGTFGTLDGGILDTQLALDHFWDEMVRYYACIVGKYGKPVQAALKKLGGLDIEMICSTHGPVWTRDIAKVIGIYDRLSRYQAEPGVVIAYGSMYGNTEQMAERIARTLAACGVGRIRLHNLSSADMSVVLRDIFDYDTLIVGSPTYNGELFPEVESLLSKIVARGIPQRRFAAFGSFCWAGAAVKRIVDTAERLGWTVLCPTVEMKQGYSHSVEQQCDELARSVAADMQ